MSGLLDSGMGEKMPMSQRNTLLPNNVSLQELLNFILKNGLLSPVANMMTPVDPVQNRQSFGSTVDNRQMMMNNQTRY